LRRLARSSLIQSPRALRVWEAIFFDPEENCRFVARLFAATRKEISAAVLIRTTNDLNGLGETLV
jgi:hypothetical protein